jgi:hypothetical protein
MSSATLTEPAARPGKHGRRQAAPPPSPPAPSAAATGLQPWHFFFAASALLAALTVVVMRPQPPATVMLAALTVLAGGYAGYALFRVLHPLVSDTAGEDASMLGGRTRAALERDKMLTLRALKELEFDRAMGKIAEGDFDEMRDRLRARAVRLMRQLDGAAGDYRDAIERDLAARLPSLAPAVPAPAVAGLRACASCGTSNEPDARFCKMCGHGLRTAS